MVRLNDLISIHENVLTKNTCEDLIEFFESNNSIQETVNQNGIPNFTQINLTKNRSGKEKVHNLIVQKVFEYRDKYYNCLLYTSPSPRDRQKSRMPSSA